MAINGDSAASWALSKVGLPYVWGGSSDSGYDCSGLMQQAYRANGMEIPRTAQTQYNAATKINPSQLKTGDLVFFSNSGSTSNITHVGMYIGDGKYVEAANPSQGVKVSTLPSVGSYFVGAGTFGNSGTASSVADIPTSSGGNFLEDVTGITAVKQKANSVVGTVLKFIALLLIFAFGVILFMRAFDIHKVF